MEATMDIPKWWTEYDSAALWCAKRGIAGNPGDRLPDGLSAEVKREIDADQDAFAETVRGHAYAIAEVVRDRAIG